MFSGPAEGTRDLAVGESLSVTDRAPASGSSSGSDGGGSSRTSRGLVFEQDRTDIVVFASMMWVGAPYSRLHCRPHRYRNNGAVITGRIDDVVFALSLRIASMMWVGSPHSRCHCGSHR
jgi:hypothetical protein